VRIGPNDHAQAVDPPPGADLIIALRDGFDRQADLLRQALSHPPAAAGAGALSDLPALITAVAGAVASLRPPPAPPPPPAADEGKAITMLLKGVELARELRTDSGGGEGEVGVMTLLRDFLRSPMLAQAVMSANQNKRPPAPRQAAPGPAAMPAPILVTAPPPAPPEPAVAAQQETFMDQLKHYLPVLYFRATEGSDATLYADIVLDNVPVETLRELLQRQPDAVSALIADYPPFEAQRAWLERMVEAVRQVLDGPGDVDAVNGSGVEGAVNVSDHSPADAAGSPAPVVPGRTSEH